MRQFPRRVVIPPGPKARELIMKDELLISQSYMRFYPLVAESGAGCILKDVDGNEYIDFSSGMACLNIGHCHPKVVEVIKQQCEFLLHYPIDAFYLKEAVSLSEKLINIAPGSFDKKIFFDSGRSESIETALKLSRWHTRRQLFLSFLGAFHGYTLGALSLSARRLDEKRYFFPLLSGVLNVPYPYCYRCFLKQNYPECHYSCIDYIEETIFMKQAPPEDVAAVIFEPIQWDGCIVPPPEYFNRLKKLADKYGFLMVDDETYTGVGRTGKWFAIEHWGVEPDILCCSNALASGLPLAVAITKAKVMDWVEGSHMSSFGGNPLSCAAANAVIDIISEERLLENAVKQGAYILKRLKELKEGCAIIGDIRGKGLMIGLEIAKGKKAAENLECTREIAIRAWRRGVVTIPCNSSTILLIPPLNITRELVDEAMDIICDVVKEVEAENNNIKNL